MTPQALLSNATRFPRHGTGVRSWLGKANFTGFQVDRQGLLSVGQMWGQREGRKLHGAFLELSDKTRVRKIQNMLSTQIYMNFPVF